ncbi:MAG: FmdB family zinc ribbon protein [Myxococcales bacterium]
MPIYEYVCAKCGHLVEIMQKISDPPPKKCERCGGRLTRVMSQSSFQLKGGGWYKDLYASSGAKKTGEKAETKSAPTAKTETTKTETAKAETAKAEAPKAAADKKK